jgi:hypothetical protein
MLNLERQKNYALQRGSHDGLILPTARQFTRMKHKQYSRKSHPHFRDAVCQRCKPGWLPARERHRLEAENTAV